MGEPLVSVGVCTYNRIEGLRQTLSCILNQTHRNLEIIVSQDYNPSIDMTLIVASFKDERIKYYRQPAQIFMNGNFSFVLSKAKGEFFMWAADDDLWEPDFISECLKKFANREVVLVAPGATMIDRNDNLLDNWTINSRFLNDDYAENFKNFLRNAFTANIGFYGLYRMSALRQVRLGNFYGNDQVLLGALLLRGKIDETGKAIFHYRCTGYSQTTGFLKSMGITKGFNYRFPSVRYLLEYFKVVLVSPISFFKKIQLLRALVPILFTIPKFKKRFKEEMKWLRSRIKIDFNLFDSKIYNRKNPISNR